ncbi:hypothetical protein EZV61_16565 [Corallincola luteus]|uniref:Uncharacterized protein n=1 Tax=Corallincola luteus TaxID=1775177 RepID=A0ABY2AKH3_9GAMM|nr:hypothetical protein [Corallincola luteus]TCI01877.1 hypothetical protein EZV61_16565 [Corallincola luteus]
MSFRRDYLPLFSIELVDNDSGLPIAARFSPTGRCSKRMANHGLLFRKRNNMAEVYYSRNPWAESPVIGAISALTQFDFSIRLPDGFYQRYQADFAGLGLRHMHLQNRAADGSLRQTAVASISQTALLGDQDGALIVSQHYQARMNLPIGASAIDIRAQFSETIVKSIAVTQVGSDTPVSVDFSGLPFGRYTLAPNNAPAQRLTVYFDDNLVGDGGHGLVAVFINQSQALAPAQGYRFVARVEPR